MKRSDIGDSVWEAEGGAPINARTGDDGETQTLRARGDDGEGPDHHRFPGGGVDGTQNACGGGDEAQKLRGGDIDGS
jgi:hypothetical protein